MNVDADLFLLRDVQPDPMLAMEQKGCAFMASGIGGEATGCFEGQKEATIDFARMHPNGTYVSNVNTLIAGSSIWGGWNLASIRFFTQELHIQYGDHINEIGKIYTMRWNDQCHFPLAAALLHPKGVKSICTNPMIADEKARIHFHGGGERKNIRKLCELKGSVKGTS